MADIHHQQQTLSRISSTRTTGGREREPEIPAYIHKDMYASLHRQKKRVLSERQRDAAEPTDKDRTVVAGVYEIGDKRFRYVG